LDAFPVIERVGPATEKRIVVAWLLTIGLLSGVDLAEIGQVASEAAPRPPEPRESRAAAHRPPAAKPEVETDQAQDTAVIDDHLAVFDRPDDRSFETGDLRRGDRVRVRSRDAGVWAAIDPPATTIGWIERESVELPEGAEARGDRGRAPTRARVVAPQAVVRSGRLDARLPGPPWIELLQGTTVRLVDRPTLTIGRGTNVRRWLAIVPPTGAACFVRADGLREPPPREGVPEVLAAYLVPEGEDPKAGGPGALPPGVAAEMTRVDADHRAILTTQPIDRWRLDTVRADYQAILKRSGDNPAVEEALRGRLAQVTRHEQAAAAAREFQEVLARSRGRDAQVAYLERRLAAADRYRTVTYHGIGYVQPSSRIIDGRKLHVLITRDGQTVAYLDIPPGLDVQSIGTQRVGVRGAVHFNQELGTSLITVREVEPVGARR
jgi:hypothetical protein